MNPLILTVPILLPILGGWAILPLHLKDDRKLQIFTEAVVCLTSVLVWINLLFTRREMVFVYAFIRGFSIEFRIDGMASLFAGMISLMWPLVTLYAFEYMEHDRRKHAFFVFYMMTYGITLGIAFSGDILTMYVFFEMLTLVTIPLVGHYGNHASMQASRKYAAYTIGGAALAFIAVVLVTLDGGNGDFVYGGILSGRMAPGLMRAAFLCAFFGFGVKAAVFPFHEWLPEASVAPTPVTALLHAVAVVNSGVFAVIRVVWYSFGPDLVREMPEHKLCLAVVSFHLVFAAAMALKQRHLKRRLAYSTVSNLSYMMFGILLLTEAGFAAGLSHMLFHSIIKMTLFLCAGTYMHQTGNAYVYETNGVGRKMPVTFALYTAAALSLTGIPMFCGFVSKWNLITAGLAASGRLSLAGVFCLVLAAFLCAMYTLTVSVRAWFPIKEKDCYTGRADVTDPGWRMLVPLGVFSACNILLGLFPGPVMAFLERIASGTL